MGEKKAPRLTPEQNEARQAARADKRQRERDVQTLALVIAQVYAGLQGGENVSIIKAVDLAVAIMRQARANVDAVRR